MGKRQVPELVREAESAGMRTLAGVVSSQYGKSNSGRLVP